MGKCHCQSARIRPSRPLKATTNLRYEYNIILIAYFEQFFLQEKTYNSTATLMWLEERVVQLSDSPANEGIFHSCRKPPHTKTALCMLSALLPKEFVFKNMPLSY